MKGVGNMKHCKTFECAKGAGMYGTLLVIKLTKGGGNIQDIFVDITVNYFKIVKKLQIFSN